MQCLDRDNVPLIKTKEFMALELSKQGASIDLLSGVTRESFAAHCTHLMSDAVDHVQNRWSVIVSIEIVFTDGA